MKKHPRMFENVMHMCVRAGRRMRRQGDPPPGPREGVTAETHMPRLFEHSRMVFHAILLKVDFFETRESAASPNMYFYFRNIIP